MIYLKVVRGRANVIGALQKLWAFESEQILNKNDYYYYWEIFFNEFLIVDVNFIVDCSEPICDEEPRQSSIVRRCESTCSGGSLRVHGEFIRTFGNFQQKSVVDRTHVRLFFVDGVDRCVNLVGKYRKCVGDKDFVALRFSVWS